MNTAITIAPRGMSFVIEVMGWGVLPDRYTTRSDADTAAAFWADCAQTEVHLRPDNEQEQS